MYCRPTDLHQIFEIGGRMEGFIRLSVHLFCDRLRDVATATNFGGKVGLFTFNRRCRIPKRNRIEYHNADWRVNSGNDLATSCEKSVNVGPVINSGVYEGRWSTVHPLVDQQ